ncbi:MAG: SusC/RagA family TonB-linked outer membrane protein, partial [Nonlabens sp.]|nr:SusC/RagA family TonB-linked outer membrane protein [Nonlabens sp.]
LVVQVAFAQQAITGKVVDATGEAIFGATVQIKGTNTGVTTDFDGNYSITAGPESTLVFSSTGYTKQEIAVAGQRTINVTLTASLDAVTLIGYRTTTTKRNTVASSTVTAKQTQDRPNASALQRLQGQVPGLTIQTNTGQPGADVTIQLRGASSINGNTEPLILLDGIPIDEDSFRTINPLDIETQTVLKDAAGTAIYGNRGANGVILITTKRGSFDQPLSVSYTSQTRFTELIDNKYNLYDSRGYLRLEQREGTGLGSTLTDAEINSFGVNTDWRDTFYRTGLSQLHNLAFRSGGKNVNQATTINYSREEGALLASDLNRFTLRNNVGFRSKDEKFSMNTSTQIGFSRNNSQTEPETRNNAIYFNSIFNSNNGLPYLNPADLDASVEEWLGTLEARLAPYVTLSNVNLNGNIDEEIKIVTGADASYKLSENWTARYQVGMDYTQATGLRWADPTSALARIRASFIGPGEVEGFQTESFFRDFRFNSLANIGYNKTFGGNEDGSKAHSIIANAYLEYVKGHFKSFSFSQTGLDPRTFSPGNDGGAFVADNEVNDEFVPTVASAKASTGLFSYFGEIDYDYDSKYGLRATLRRDASSRFIDDNKWGTFYSVAARWNISDEDFMQGVNWVTELKLRASYGSTGNDRITGGYYGALNNFRTLFGTGQVYNDQQAFFRSQLGNSDLRWETIKTANIGIDFGFFNNRLRGSLDVYDRATEDLFFTRFVSQTVTPDGQIEANLGDMTNRGVELGIAYNLLVAQDKNQVGLTLTANVAYNRNKVTFVDLPDGIQDNVASATVIQEGVQLNEFFVVPYLGVNPANGNLLYLDINGNPTESPTLEDRRLTGTDTNPDYQGGFGFQLDYQNFFLETQFTFMTGLQRFDNNLSDYYDITSLGIFNLSSDLERSWTPTNRVTDMPSLSATNIEPGVTSDRFLIDSDFLRLRFLQVGYNFDQNILDKTFIKGARVYVNAENLATFSKWLGSDPESRRTSEYNRYPTPRIVSFGFDINF